MLDERVYRWRRQLFRWALWGILYRFWFKISVSGWDNIPAEGPVVMMVNHIHLFDPVLMISFYPDRDIVPIAKIESWSQPIIRYFVRHWGAIPVNRGEADMRALKAALEHIRRGDIVLLFAEGTRTKTGLIQGKEGSAYIAVKTDATVVPVALWGTTAFPEGWFGEFKRIPVHVSFGKPFRFRRESDERLPREHFRQMTDEAMYRIAGMLPEHLRGVYSDMSKATTELLDFEVAWRPPVRALPRRAVAPNPITP
jgi:1-acyl-sn-glycerol-3-phosphate acyltransferase